METGEKGIILQWNVMLSRSTRLVLNVLPSIFGLAFKKETDCLLVVIVGIGNSGSTTVEMFCGTLNDVRRQMWRTQTFLTASVCEMVRSAHTITTPSAPHARLACYVQIFVCEKAD